MRWPARPVAVVEPGREPGPDGCGERDVAAVEVEATVDDVGQLQFADLLAGQPWKATSATASATAGFGESSSARIRAGASGSGSSSATRVRSMPSSGW